MSEEQFVCVAKLGKSIGLKGYIRLHNLSDFPSQFKKDAVFFTSFHSVCDIDFSKKLTIKHYNSFNKIVLFENYNSREKVKELTNIYLYQSIEYTRNTCILKKDEYFYFDILGCELWVFMSDLKLQKIGKVKDIIENTMGYLFEIQTDENMIKKGFAKIFYVPYLDKFVKKIEIEKSRIFCTIDVFFILENS
ncbi:ribosome maturation factor RimM [Campylobacter sp. MIT 21-1685]|uniref:ribosome maturation factor RimM n=1 Tax=unclassified Campylobacter TaxID=2593542 RepID=UPI00224B3487|nr:MULTISPECIES: ribosome maturation factor RimM [unclassified Campylobacter]MCX2682791.1 ribosome maturation factor RimM [Campylobacter sp. MIT 21-1684]MCX2751063.1 ribosome maturation factor RimM [Campylobacter sp. MIT 21-1682]MCX2807272.1 ribosome maturation factor RimM [Campylobacter sp. MIT 21-1685]